VEVADPTGWFLFSLVSSSVASPPDDHARWEIAQWMAGRYDNANRLIRGVAASDLRDGGFEMVHLASFEVNVRLGEGGWKG